MFFTALACTQTKLKTRTLGKERVLAEAFQGRHWASITPARGPSYYLSYQWPAIHFEWRPPSLAEHRPARQEGTELHEASEPTCDDLWQMKILRDVMSREISSSPVENSADIRCLQERTLEKPALYSLRQQVFWEGRVCQQEPGGRAFGLTFYSITIFRSLMHFSFQVFANTRIVPCVAVSFVPPNLFYSLASSPHRSHFMVCGVLWTNLPWERRREGWCVSWSLKAINSKGNYSRIISPAYRCPRVIATVQW